MRGTVAKRSRKESKLCVGNDRVNYSAKETEKLYVKSVVNDKGETVPVPIKWTSITLSHSLGTWRALYKRWKHYA